jgi:hypothetical protein
MIERRSMLAIEQALLSLLLALACAAAPWLAQSLRSSLLVIGLVIGVLLSVLGAALALPLYPWSNLVVLLVALTAGLLVGRSVPPRFGPLLALLAILSALDTLQIALTGGLTPLSHGAPPATAAAPSGPLLYLNVLLHLPAGHYLLGALDLLVLTAVAQHWRRRGGSYLIALLPGVLGFLLAYGVVWLTQLGDWPLIPFFTVGWLGSEGIRRFLIRRARSGSSGSGI